MKQAYVTLLSSTDYLPAVLILNRNLKELNSKYPLVVMVTDNIAQLVISYLENEHIEFVIISTIAYTPHIQSQYKNSSILNTASKIALFSLTQYDKLIYLDADAIFFQNIDELFSYNDGAIYEEINGSSLSGLFCCCPNNHNYNFYKTLLTQYDTLDGDLISELFFPYKSNKDYHIPTNYFINITADTLDLYDLKNIIGIHFCYIYKPWKYTDVDEYFNDYYKVIQQERSQNRYNIIQFYIKYYCENLRYDYPEIF